MAERKSNEIIFSDKMLKLKSEEFPVLAGQPVEISGKVTVKTGDMAYVNGELKIYTGSTTIDYGGSTIQKVSVSPLLINTGANWTAEIKDHKVQYTVKYTQPNFTLMAKTSVELVSQCFIQVPKNMKAILNGVLTVGNSEYVLTTPHTFNIANNRKIIFSNETKTIVFSYLDDTTWQVAESLQNASVFLTYLT